MSSGFCLHEVGCFPRPGAFFYICRSLSLEDISHESRYPALGAQWGWQLNGYFWRVGRGHVGYSWRYSVMSIKFKIFKTAFEYTIGFLDWLVGSFKTVRDANADADADVVMGVASKPASQVPSIVLADRPAAGLALTSKVAVDKKILTPLQCYKTGRGSYTLSLSELAFLF